MYVENVKRNMRRYVKRQYTPGGSRGCSKETDENLLFQTSDSTTSSARPYPGVYIMVSPLTSLNGAKSSGLGFNRQ